MFFIYYILIRNYVSLYRVKMCEFAEVSNGNGMRERARNCSDLLSLNPISGHKSDPAKRIIVT